MDDECDVHDQNPYSNDVRVVGLTLCPMEEFGHPVDFKYPVQPDGNSPETKTRNQVEYI